MARADELLQKVYERPEDEALRLVLADALLEVGDPRGELIVLQCSIAKAPLDEGRRRREAELLARHWRQWVGPLAPFLDKPHFAGGFLSSCGLRPGAPTAVEWATVTEVDLLHDDLSVLLDPAFRSLRSVVVTSAALLPSLPPLPFEELSLRHGAGGSALDGGAEILRLLEATRPAPRLRRLQLWSNHADVARYRGIFTGLARHVTHLEVSSGWRSLPDWIDEIEAHRRPLDRLSVESGVTLGRGSDGKLSTLEAWAGDYLVFLLDSLPGEQLRRLTVTGLSDEGLRQKLERAARRQRRLVTLTL